MGTSFTSGLKYFLDKENITSSLLDSLLDLDQVVNIKTIKDIESKILANVSLLKAYATAASTGGDRAKAIAYITGGLSLGLVTGPGFQLIFTPIGTEGWRISENLAINMYTCPALFAIFVNILGTLMVAFRFREAYVGIPDKNTLVCFL